MLRKRSKSIDLNKQKVLNTELVQHVEERVMLFALRILYSVRCKQLLHVPTCGGSGETVSKSPPGADKDGLIRKEGVITIKIPAGVSEGMQLNVSGKGNAAPGNGVPGDLLVVIEEKSDDELTREGNNLIYELYINFADAASRYFSDCSHSIRQSKDQDRSGYTSRKSLKT